MKAKNPVSKITVAGILSIFALTACGGGEIESPEVVLSKAKQALVQVESGSVAVDADVEGSNGEDDLDFSGNLTVSFDKRDAEDHKLDLHIDLSGNMQAGEQTLDGDLDLEFITVAKEYYVKLNELSSSDPSIQQIEPFITLYEDKWLRIAEDFIPENIRNLQGEDEAMVMKREQLEALFVDTELFTVVKEYGIEKLDGEKVYHYGLQVNQAGFEDYVKKAAIIDGNALTDAEVTEAVEVLSYLEETEVFIDVEDYYVRKAVFRFSGAALSQETDGANLNVEITVNATDFNESVSIEAPDAAEDFNPLNLIMGLGGAPTLEVPAEIGDTETEEAVVTEESDDEASQDEVSDQEATEGDAAAEEVTEEEEATE